MSKSICSPEFDVDPITEQEPLDFALEAQLDEIESAEELDESWKYRL